MPADTQTPGWWSLRTSRVGQQGKGIPFYAIRAAKD